MDFTDPEHSQPRLIGDYILGPKIGAGSFAVVWRSTHRHSGMEVAVKEIDKKHLNAKVSENLLKEITILGTINHPNIIRLFDAIQTKDRLYLILEYCNGGDLAAYLNRYGKVSEAVASHFMRQLAAGLKVLQEKHLIHRDLKPQNLLLSTNGENSMLKIGDFGFARSLKQGLADTLCGSPLYMAPEIIRNEKYDSKADLWSVGAILFQLVTGKPPFEGNNQLQLFQNILTSTVLQFPEGALDELHPNCIDLCRSLLRQNPIERMTFTEFFNHPFLMEPRLSKAVESPSLQSEKSAVNEIATGSSDGKSQFYLEHPMESSCVSTSLADSAVFGRVAIPEREDYSLSSKSVRVLRQDLSIDKVGKSIPLDPCSSSQIQVSDSMESIEKDYVLVNANFASMETFFSSIETSLQDFPLSRLSTCSVAKNDQPTTSMVPIKELISSSVDVAEGSQSQRSEQQSTSCASSVLREVQGLKILHPSTRLHLLHQYGQVLLELSQEKCNAGLVLESFAVELVILALWKNALQVCSSWMDSTPENELSSSSLTKDSTDQPKDTGSTSNTEENIDFRMPSSVFEWAKGGFFTAIDRANKLSSHIKTAHGLAEMPDAMEIIFQKALEVGKSAAVDEYMGNNSKAAALYSKAVLLLSFIAGEAPSLPLNPAFSLTPADRKRIEHYILNLQTRQTNLVMPLPSPSLKVNPDSK